jgi:4-amino-4-deoxy-L-arabinose transferase-like glycosyltransferase
MKNLNLIYSLLTNIKQKYFTIGFFLIYFIIGMFIFQDYGLGWDDECSRMDTGYVNCKYMATHDAKPLLEGNEKYHGPAFEIALVIIEKTFHLTDTRDIYLMRHAVMFILFFASVVAFFFAARKLFNQKLALLACLFLVLSPRIFAESFYNTKDIGLLAMFNFSLFTYFNFYEHKNTKWAIWHGIASGLLISVRIIGIVMPIMTLGYFAIWMVMNKANKQIILNFVMYVIVSFGVMVASWPVMWEGLFYHFGKAFSEMSHYHWVGDCYFMGKDVDSAKLPWHYLPLWILITTPLLYIVLFIAGMMGYLKNIFTHNGRNFFENFYWNSIIALCLFPIVSVVVLKSVIYDGWRHVYFIYPLLILIATLGLNLLYALNWQSKSIQHYQSSSQSIHFI